MHVCLVVGAKADVNDKVSIYLSCTGLTEACRAACGHNIKKCRTEMGHSQSSKAESMRCSCGVIAVGKHKNICSCSPHAQQDSHFRCRCRFRVDIAGPDFAVAVIHESSENQAAHGSDEPNPKKQRKLP